MKPINTKRRYIALITTIFAAFALAACSGDEVPAATTAPPAAPVPTATTAPTATFIVVKVTVAPIPTEIPAPTATPEPTAVPTAELTEEVAEKIKAITRAQPSREFPAAISKGAERLDKEAVLAEWTKFLGGARTFSANESIILDWCSNGSGTWVYETGTPAFTGAKFDWELKSDPGGSWNSTIVIIRMHEKKLFDLMNYAGGDGFRLGLTPPNQGDSYGAYVSPDCQ